MNYINSLIQKTFKRRLGKNIGTLIGIALSVSLMVGVQITVTSFASEALGLFTDIIGENDIIISGITFPLTDYEDIIEKIDNASIEYAGLNARVTQNVALYNFETGGIEKGVNLQGFEFDEDEMFGKLYDLNESEYTIPKSEMLLDANNSVLIGETLLEELELDVGSIVKIRIGELNIIKFAYEYKTYDFEIKGVIANEDKGKDSGNWALWMNIDDVRPLVGYSQNQVTEINIALSSNHEENPISNEEAKLVEDQLNVLLNADESGLIVLATRALVLEAAEDILNDVLLAFNLFGALIIFSGVLLLVNIQLIQVEDRLQQLGILRAIGSRRREIIRWFLVESIILGMIGSFLGILGGYGMSSILVWQIGKVFFEGVITLTPTVTAGAIGYSMTVGSILSVLAGILPAIRASRVDVIEVIRGIKKVPRKRTGTYSLPLGLAFVVAGISVLATQIAIKGSYFGNNGWDTSIEQWMFLAAAAGLLIGVSILLGYVFSKKLLGNSLGFSLIILAILMLMFALPILKDPVENSKLLITLVVVLALATIIWIGVNLSSVTNFVRNLLYRTRLKKGVSLIASKYMTSKSIRSTLTFGIFTLVLTMNIFASVYQTTYSFNTLESVEFYSGGASIFIELDTPISSNSTIDVERDLYFVDPAITDVKGINSTFAILEIDEESNLDFPTEILPGSIDLVYNDTFKTGDEYRFDFILGLSIGAFNDKYNPAASEEYQREYSQELWDTFYNRTKINKDGEIDNENGLPTVISTNPALSPGDIFNITTLKGIFIRRSIRVIVLAVVNQYPFSLSGGFPSMLVTEDMIPFILTFDLYPRYTKYLVSTNEDFREGRNEEIAENIEHFFNSNDSVLIQQNEFVAASAHSVWEEMLEMIDFQVKTFDFMQYFVSFGLVVGALGMIIIAVRNVSERRREIGMMRAIGYKKQQIIGTIMLELFIISGLGLVMGLINGIFLGWSFARLYDWFLIIPVARVFIYTSIMIGIALIASIVPGIRASRITPAEALRYVG